MLIGGQLYNLEREDYVKLIVLVNLMDQLNIEL